MKIYTCPKCGIRPATTARHILDEGTDRGPTVADPAMCHRSGVYPDEPSGNSDPWGDQRKRSEYFDEPRVLGSGVRQHCGKM